ncbi:uncharacterized protein A4U43_C07F38130 [Asparagus officinalis]|uniref:TPX2 C-terminal domain-containing protein n=1 Tax=Asparagus officinalis TaxID=4686 RepID=A0A5P1EHX2_ASPOF|nr:protein TPX2 [Asparagus officinalis]ONK65538.1 uncharacterized protein A4U43_C07F38130 [Asparagus officinalis]
MGSESKGGVDALQIDETYEFCAPRFFDFMNEETEDEVKSAELWFEISQSYAPSPFILKIKEGRSIQIDSLCDFGDVEQTDEKKQDVTTCAEETTRGAQNSIVAAEAGAGDRQEMKDGKMSFEFAPEVRPCDTSLPIKGEKSASEPIDTVSKEPSSFAFPILPSSSMASAPARTPKAVVTTAKGTGPSSSKKQGASEACTPKPQRVPSKGVAAPNSSKSQTARKIASIIRQPSALKLKDQTPCAQSSKSIKPPKSTIKYPGSTHAKNKTDIAQENQAIKRQKLDGGNCRQILNVKTRVLHHKSKPDSAGSTDIFASLHRGSREGSLTQKEQPPFISTAEMVNKFQSKTRDIQLSQNKPGCHESVASMIKNRPRLKLTRPKEPEFETAQRVRAVRIKSSAELEEEMLAKIPKFKARPVNKKILEAPSLPSLVRSMPQPPEFKEFHLKTMERANQHAETSSVASSVDTSTTQNQNKACKLTEPRPPRLETSLRARPPKIKSSQELELEELEKLPKFKARPLNKKILESKGDLGLFHIPKPQITTPQEFHFATDERLGPPLPVTEMFDKLSIHSESSSRHEQQEIPRITVPNPFHLHTEERGLEKERQFTVHILQKQLEEEKARVPKANPYPYTTDYPVIPPKPEPKRCTKPEAFQLESLIRHEEEMQRIMEEKERMEREEAQKRLFKAQPIMKEDPIPLPERERRPLTDVQEFVLQVDHRAVERSEFDKKIKDKELMYKRLREENEAAKLVEEEKAVKQMRREMVPHARPLPKFDNPFLPQKSTKDLTEARSPMLRVKQRKEQRKHAFLR